jgi:hypothetical protein
MITVIHDAKAHQRTVLLQSTQAPSIRTKSVCPCQMRLNLMHANVTSSLLLVVAWWRCRVAPLNDLSLADVPEDEEGDA